MVAYTKNKRVTVSARQIYTAASTKDAKIRFDLPLLEDFKFSNIANLEMAGRKIQNIQGQAGEKGKKISSVTREQIKAELRSQS